MKIVLLRSVDKLGVAGQVVDVRKGYFRNFLGPRSLAILASAANLKRVESQRKALESLVVNERKEAETMAARLSGVELSFAVRANDKGQLFGAVTSGDVAQQLKDKGYDVDRRKVEMGGTIKALGPHPVKIRLYPEIYAEVKVEVTRLIQAGEEMSTDAEPLAPMGTAQVEEDDY